MKDMNKLVDVMCTATGRTPLPAEKTQMYFNVATRIDKEYRETNQGRGGTSSRNIHLAEILGEDSEENVPLENNVHEVLLDGDDDVDGEVDMEMYQALATIFRGLKMNKATWDG